MITVSIVSGSQERNLRRCLQSLGPAMETLTWQLMVTDNCASWDVEAVVREFFPQAIVLHNKTMIGFGANHNRALRDCKDRYALILNDDIELDASSVKRLRAFAEQTPSGAIFGPVLYPRTWGAKWIPAGGPLHSMAPKPFYGVISMILRLLFGNEFIVSLLQFRWGVPQPHNEKRGYISGACCLVKRSFIQKHGLYDESFYMYYEDIDLGKRVQSVGCECWQVADARIIHLGGSSFSDRTWSWLAQSSLRYAQKHHGIAVCVITQILVSIFKGIYAVRGWICGSRAGKD